MPRISPSVPAAFRVHGRIIQLAISLVVAGCTDGSKGPGSDRSAAVSAATPATTEASPMTSGSTAATASATPPAACETPCLDIEKCEAGRCVPNCPKATYSAGEVYIPATGAKGFTVGANPKNNVNSAHQVVLTQPFCMDKTEVTVRAYKECVDAKVCKAARTWGMWISYPTKLDHPVNKVHFNHGKTYCEWRNQSLPTEAQWEWAATGGDGRKYAWGNDAPTCEHADYTPGHLRGPSSDDGCRGGGSSPVGSMPKGDKVWPDGRIHDLSGNLWEWCLDNYRAWRQTATVVDPLYLVAPNSTHVVRGGGWNRSDVGITTYFRGASPVEYQVPGLGFRCVRNPKAPTPPSAGPRPDKPTAG